MDSELGIDLDRLKSWIVCIASVKFDIDEGQITEFVCPKESLTENESRVLSSSSFPDSNSFQKDEGGLRFIITLKKDKKDELNQDFYYGFVYFQQNKDIGNSRGFSQRSIVVLTTYPFLRFFSKLGFLLGTEFFRGDISTDIIEVDIK